MRHLLLLGLALLACGCDSSTDPDTPPASPDAPTARIQVDVEPDWVGLGWRLTAGEALTVAGTGDSLVTVAAATPCTLVAIEDTSLVVAGQSWRVIMPDTAEQITARLAYRAVPWQRLHRPDPEAVYHAVLPLADGGVVAGGSRGGDRWLRRLDHRGRTVWDVWEASVDRQTFFALLPLGEGAVLVGGGGDQGHVAAWSLAGEQLWSAQLDSVSLMGIVAGPAGGSTAIGLPSYPRPPATVLLRLDGAGQELARHTVASDAATWPFGLARREDGRFWLLRSVRTDDPQLMADVELLVVDAQGAIQSSRILGRAEPGLGLSLLPLRDGGVLVTSLAHEEPGEAGPSRVHRVSADGSVAWCRDLGAAGMEALTAGQETADGAFRLVGWIHDHAADDFSVRTVELAPDGTLVADRRRSTGARLSYLHGLAGAWDGGAFVHGELDDGAWLLRTGPDLVLPDPDIPKSVLDD